MISPPGRENSDGRPRVGSMTRRGSVISRAGGTAASARPGRQGSPGACMKEKGKTMQQIILEEGAPTEEELDAANGPSLSGSE